MAGGSSHYDHSIGPVGRKMELKMEAISASQQTAGYIRTKRQVLFPDRPYPRKLIGCALSSGTPSGKNWGWRCPPWGPSRDDAADNDPMQWSTIVPYNEVKP